MVNKGEGGRGWVIQFFTQSESPPTHRPPWDAPWGRDAPCGRRFNFAISQHKIHEDPTWDPDVCCWARRPSPSTLPTAHSDSAAEYQLSLAANSWI